MFSAQTIAHIQKKVFDIVGFQYDGTLKVTAFDGVQVRYADGMATIGCPSRSQLARGLFLLAKELSAGKQTVTVQQKPYFRELGVMLSVQVPKTVNTVVDYMAHMAALGFNYLLLYMETSYEVKEYPFFGYMRGCYTADELRAIDEAGDALGIEVIPCVQTFGHMTNYLRWPAAAPVRENAECLLVGEEKTYAFIETLIRTLRGIFKTKRIHVGFDETRGLGLGKSFKLHGPQNPVDMYNYHLTRVKEICFRHGLKPMIWSDMPFRLGGDGESGEYDMKSVIPESTLKAMEGVDLCFWDYYNVAYEFYDSVMKRHKSFPGANILFSGGVWVLDNYIMNMPHTLNTMKPALRAALDNQIASVNATVWGNAGNTNHDQSFFGLPVFSEYCYLGHSCTEEDIYSTMEYLTKVSRRFLAAACEFHLGYKDSLKLGSRFVCCDILYRMLRHSRNRDGTPVDFDAMPARLETARQIVLEDPGCNEDILPRQYAANLLEIAAIKCRILSSIRDRYLARDWEYLREVSDVLIPKLIPLYEQVGEQKQALWLKGTKPFGIEVIQMDFAAMIARMRFTQKRLHQLINGEISVIEELEEDVLEEDYIDWLGDHAHMSSNGW